jgi:hypothetical protein
MQSMTQQSLAPAADIVEEVSGLTVWDGARRRARVSSFVLRQALVIRDRDRIYGIVVTRRLRAMGNRDKPTAPASPWQNGYAERLIGSIWHECLDHVIVLGEAHLRRVLRYYNCVRTHRSLRMHRSLARYSAPVSSVHAPSWADFITTMVGFRGFRYTHPLRPSLPH